MPELRIHAYFWAPKKDILHPEQAKFRFQLKLVFLDTLFDFIFDNFSYDLID
jgi:hypothetical protein